MAIMFLSKYALTEGIKEVEVDPMPSGKRRYVIVETMGITFCFNVGDDIHFLHDDAVKKANMDRIEQIKSLENQIVKLKALTFT